VLGKRPFFQDHKTTESVGYCCPYRFKKGVSSPFRFTWIRGSHLTRYGRCEASERFIKKWNILAFCTARTEYGGSLETPQWIANHEDPRTRHIDLAEIERIRV